MNLISCNSCASVFDAKKLNFPGDFFGENEDGNWGPNLKVATWSGEQYCFVAFVRCPICNAKILEGE